MTKSKKIFIKVSCILLVYIVVIDPIILPKLGLGLYNQKIIINYYHSNKKDFEFVVNNIRNKGVSNIDMDNGRIIFHGNYKNKSYEKQHLYDGDEELIEALKNLFNGYINVQSIDVVEADDEEYERFQFSIDSYEFRGKFQSLIYTNKGRKPLVNLGYRSESVKINENWHYYFEDLSDELPG